MLPQVNESTKRMISINYILRKLFEMLGLPYENIKTLKYNQWWNNVYGLIKDDIHKIVNK